jgi:hypothetical protein
LTEGVTKARVEIHRLRLLLDRANSLVEQSDEKERLWQLAGDLLLGIPERVKEAELALDRTSYALSLMGEDFLRGRLPLEDRNTVDEGAQPHPMAPKESSESRVARRFLKTEPVAPSAEGHFFDAPKSREVREFACSEAITNLPESAATAVRQMENAEVGPGKARQKARKAPPPPSVIDKKPGGKDFSTLNRYLVETEEPGVRGVPQGREEIPKMTPPVRKSK